MLKPIIAIDGPAASGKGTLAKNLAAHFNFAHLDTGAVYRLTALRMIETGEDAQTAANFLKHGFEVTLTQNPALRTDEVGSLASKISADPDIRYTLESIQKSFAQNPPEPFKGAVLDGRDIGTHIAPQAALKCYISCRAEIRAQRRFKELQLAGIPVSYDAVLTDMIERDTRDQTREFRPLKPADDAILLDTSDLTADDVLQKAIGHVRSALVL